MSEIDWLALALQELSEIESKLDTETPGEVSEPAEKFVRKLSALVTKVSALVTQTNAKALIQDGPHTNKIHSAALRKVFRLVARKCEVWPYVLSRHVNDVGTVPQWELVERLQLGADLPYKLKKERQGKGRKLERTPLNAVFQNAVEELRHLQETNEVDLPTLQKKDDCLSLWRDAIFARILATCPDWKDHTVFQSVVESASASGDQWADYPNAQLKSRISTFLKSFVLR